MPSRVVIVDYRTGNLSAVKRGIERAGGEAVISAEVSYINKCDKLVLAGVGHFETAINAIHSLRLRDALENAVQGDGKPVLGVCLGMEIMARGSEEGRSAGLGWIDASVVGFNISDRLKFKVPQIGWNTLRRVKDSRLLRMIPENSEFYFNHSYYLSLAEPEMSAATTTYETAFVSAIEKGNIFGVQFHPEKSHEMGDQVLRNFLEI